MSVDSRALIRANVSLEQIVSCLSTQYADVEVVASHTENFFRIAFSSSNEEERYKRCSVWTSFDFECSLFDFGIKGVYVSANHRHPEGVRVIRLLCETFGGYFDESDSDDEDFLPVNAHLLEQVGELSELDKFKHKVIAKLGFTKLNDALELLNDYVTLTKTVGTVARPIEQ